MIVTLDIPKLTCTLTKETGDPRFTRGGWGEAESRLLYHVKQALITQGHDVIKKRMWKDGNMVDDTQQWVRTRKWSKEYAPDEFAVFNNGYMVFDAGEEFNHLKPGETMRLSVFVGDHIKMR